MKHWFTHEVDEKHQTPFLICFALLTELEDMHIQIKNYKKLTPVDDNAQRGGCFEGNIIIYKYYLLRKPKEI